MVEVVTAGRSLVVRGTDSFAARVSARLSVLGWKCADLSAASGLDPGHLSRVLNGKRAITSEALESIAEALGVSPMEIAAGTEVAAAHAELEARAHPVARDDGPMRRALVDAHRRNRELRTALTLALAALDKARAALTGALAVPEDAGNG